MDMDNNVVEKMLSYLANATKEELAEDYEEIVNNHEGPLAIDIISAQLNFFQQSATLFPLESLQTDNSDYGVDFNENNYCLAS